MRRADLRLNGFYVPCSKLFFFLVLDLEIPFIKRDALDFEFVPVFFGTEAYHLKRFSTDQRFFVFYFRIFDATVRDTLLIVY